jgi:hypothetical protein
MDDEIQQDARVADPNRAMLVDAQGDGYRLKSQR